ncbi:MAG: hypothetical protein QN198_00605 [Armatimonadota bacterium]|nr:hypothetical protein [Armatimonadota bacterium]MDR5702082.1 hypothetical protein [Armatimonadota bacterium]MDR7434607.1 hypothetical protein [Armatimonadota bacterium]
MTVAMWTTARTFLERRQPGQGRASHLIVVDAGNAFDPYIISDAARAAGEIPERWLARVSIARAFTVHQLEVLITKRLPALCGEASPVLLLGLLDLFGDEAVPNPEAHRIFRGILWTFQRLVKRRCHLLVACPSPVERSREAHLFPLLRRLASWILRIQATGDGSYLVLQEHPNHASRISKRFVWGYSQRGKE